MRNPAARVCSELISTCCGDKEHIIYSARKLPNGEIKLFESDRVDIQEKINSYADQCDMSFIISRLSMGDTSVLNPNKPLYGDFTQFPKSFRGMYDLVHAAEAAFDALPPDTRKEFNYDVAKWFSEAGSPDWIKVMFPEKDNVSIDVEPKPASPSAVPKGGDN